MDQTTHVFYLGDTAKVIKNIKKESIQFIITSPPYWNAKNYDSKIQLGYRDTYKEYLRKLKSIIKGLEKLLLPDGKIALNIGNIYCQDFLDKRHFTINLIQDVWKMLYSNKKLRYMGTIYWKKTTSRNGAVLFGSYPFPSNFMISTGLESIHVFRKVGKRKVAKSIKIRSKISKKGFREIREPIWYLNGVSKKEHPAVFPKKMVNRLIRMYSFVGDTILDPFCGIGTSNIEASVLLRNSIGIDVNKKYLQTCITKLKNLSNPTYLIRNE
jgi:modification methylase